MREQDSGPRDLRVANVLRWFERLFSWVSQSQGRMALYYDQLRRAAGQVLETSGVRVVSIHWERLECRGPFFLVSNHTSLLNAVALLHLCPCMVRFISKPEVAKLPEIGPAVAQYVRAQGYMLEPYRRESVIELDRAAQTMIDERSAVNSFPETKLRVPLGPFEPAAFRLAWVKNCGAIPIAQIGFEERLPPGSFEPRPGIAELRVGERITVSGEGYPYERQQLAQQAREVLVDLGVPS